VWSISFICTEALDGLASNKQHPTPVWNMPKKGIDSHTSDEWVCFSLMQRNCPDFRTRIKAKTLSSMSVPRDLTKLLFISSFPAFSRKIFVKCTEVVVVQRKTNCFSAGDDWGIMLFFAINQAEA